MLLTASLTDLYSPVYDVALIEKYDQVEKMFDQFFYVKDDDSAKFESTSISALGIWEKVAEGQAITRENPVQMYNTSYTHEKYGVAMDATEEALEDDEYALLTMFERAEMIGVGAGQRVERVCADIFNNHTSTAGADGVALVDGSHPKNPDESGTLFDNELTGTDSALDHDSIEDMEILFYANCKGPKGNFIPKPSKGILLVPPQLEGTGDRIVNERAVERPDTAARDINRYAGKYALRMWQYLDGSTTAWWLVFPSFKGLRFFWRRHPSFDSYFDPGSESYVFNGKMRLSVGWEGWGWRTVWGSVGS